MMKIVQGCLESWGGALENLGTCIQGDDYMEILRFNGNSFTLLDTIPLNSKTKSTLKKIVCHLMDKCFHTLEIN